jgi:ATP-dependent DNA helicase RecG
LSDYGEINNRTIQRLFDVDVYQARDILKSLVGREIIVRTSVAARGATVKYSPGAAFPASKARKTRSKKMASDDTSDSRLF